MKLPSTHLVRFVLALLCTTPTSCMMVGVGTRQHDLSNHGEGLWIREELTFGTDIPGGGMVSDQEWQRFVDEVVSPRFPQGFSLSTGFGQYRMKNGDTVREKNWVLVFYLEVQTPENERALDEIIQGYKRRFRQESVLRATSTARVRFEE